MTFAAPKLLHCESVAPACTPAIACELDHGHDVDLHRNGPVVWHDPILILVDGESPDLTVDTDHWVNGAVVLEGEEPPL